MSTCDRLLIRAPNWLGDAVMALPALAAVRRAYADRAIVIAARPSVAPLFREQTIAGAEEVLVVDERSETGQIRAAQADAVLLLPNSFRSAWTARLAGVRERWGYLASGRGWLLTRGVRRPRAAGRPLHHVEYYRALVKGLGIELGEDAIPRLQARVSTLEKADALLERSGIAPGQRIAGFAPGAAYGTAKRWPPDRVATVIVALARRGTTAVLVGAAGDRDTGRAIESALPTGVTAVNLIGRTSLGELIGVVARCAAFVSNDSGAMHVAAALGVPVTALFGPTDERVTAPMSAGGADVIVRDVFCRPCLLRECPIDHRCMKRIDVDTVLASVSAHLG
jgi:lipopolysaccharide heptosyltransferase II